MKNFNESPLAVILMYIIIVPVVILVNTWIVMLLFGAVHSFWDVVPAFGFWQTFLVILLVGMFRSTFKKEE